MLVIEEAVKYKQVMNVPENDEKHFFQKIQINIYKKLSGKSVFFKEFQRVLWK